MSKLPLRERECLRGREDILLIFRLIITFAIGVRIEDRRLPPTLALTVAAASLGFGLLDNAALNDSRMIREHESTR
jgi:hypothetical protein